MEEKKKKQYVSDNAQLMAEWHPTKNNTLLPNQVASKSSKKVWWKCENGHEWEATVINRTSHSSGCPYCSGRLVTVGINDLATTHPEIAAEWHPTLNGTLKPTDVSSSVRRKVWWQCSKGHEWEAVVYSRKQSGCPYCSGEMKTSFPEQAIFFYFQRITTAYNRYQINSRTEIDIYLPDFKVGIEYDGAYFHKGNLSEVREKRKTETLSKMGISLIRVKEVDSPESKVSDVNIIYCNKYHTSTELKNIIEQIFKVVGTIINRTLIVDVDINRDRSKIYAQYIESEKSSSLLNTNPILSAQWHPYKNEKLTPLMVSAKSNKKVWWKCEKGHEWQAVISSRTNRHNCPYCSGQKVLKGENDLATVNPDLATQWHPSKNKNLTSSDITANSSKKVWWLCDKGHEWQAAVYSRSIGSGCPYCANFNQRVLIGYNDLLTTNPILASEWHPTKNGELSPEMFISGSSKKVWWRCKKCSNEWEATIRKRTSGQGCPYCSGRVAILGKNDLETCYPEIAKEWDYDKNKDIKPNEVKPFSHKKVWWKCTNGHEYELTVRDKVNRKGCPYCSNTKILTGFNDLSTKFPQVASEWHFEKNAPILPSEVMYGSGKKVWWKCNQGHEWQAQVYYRTTKQLICPICAKKKRKSFE